MANHKRHQQGAFVVGGVGATAAFILGMTSLPQAFIVFLAGYTGAMAPDLDHDQGKSLKATFRLLSILIPIFAIWRHVEWQSSLMEIGIMFAVIATIIYFPIQWFFKKLTVHRGIFHSIPACFIYGAVLFLLVGKKTHDLSFQKAVGITATLGYFIHLLLDEYSSLGFNGQRFRVKRSLGTAIDFIKPNKIVTALAYIILFGLAVPVLQQW